MFFKKYEKKDSIKKVILEYKAYPASGVDFEESSSESYTNNLPNHTVISKNTWEYEKMEDVPYDYACNYLKAVCKKEGINFNVLRKLMGKLEITYPYYEKILDFIDDKNMSALAYVNAMLDAYRINSKEIYQCLNTSYGQVLTEEIINNLDYQFAMRLADNDDAYNRSLSVAEKMQILYSHQMLLKK